MSKPTTTVKTDNIALEAITNAEVSATAGIVETKLQLDYPTAALRTGSLLIDADRVVADGVSISFQSIIFRDTVTGRSYRMELQNGVAVFLEL